MRPTLLKNNNGKNSSGNKMYPKHTAALLTLT
jgi:hypothetical protein